MTDTSAFFAGARSAQQTGFDQYDRYLLPDENGEYTGWTRATTFAATLATSYGLRIWEQRQVVWGLSRRPDLLALANTISGPEDKKALGAIVEQAHEAAGTKAKANDGDAVHKATECHDRGEPVPTMHTADVAAYAREMQAYGYTVLPEGIERIVIVPQYHVAGRFDRLVLCPDGKIRVLDIKTGNLDYAQLEFAIQLSLYANASMLWNPSTKEYMSMPEVATDYAIIAHIPAGSGTCEMMRVSIDVGWVLARLCAEERDAQQLKHLITPMPRTAVFVGETGPELYAKPVDSQVTAYQNGASEFEEFWSTAPDTDDEAPDPAPDDAAIGSTDPKPEPGAAPSVPVPDAPPLPVGEDEWRPGDPPVVEPVDMRGNTDPEQLAQAIVKTAKGKAKVQQYARELLAALGLPESTIKLNQQQIKIARAIVELATSKGAPVPGVPAGFVPIAVDQTTFDANAETPPPPTVDPAVANLFEVNTIKAIEVAPTVGMLQQIREVTGQHWTSTMNEAARQRAEVLNAETGEEPLTAMQMIEGATSKQTLSLAWKVATSDGQAPDGWTAELHQAAQAKLQQLN